jgi:hypothetical protein
VLKSSTFLSSSKHLGHGFVHVKLALHITKKNIRTDIYSFVLLCEKQIGRVQERQRFEELQSSGRHPVSIYRFHCLQLVGQIGNLRIVFNGFKVLSF